MVKVSWAVVLVGVVACGDGGPEVHVVGQLWSDDNGNGVRDPDEAPLAGVVVFANLDLDPTINSNDPVSRTSDLGIYDLVVPGPGTYEVRAVLPFGFRPRSMSEKRIGVAPIIGGNDAGPNDYGFMVALADRFGSQVFQFCGGVLVDEQHVVTAAHCSVGANVEDIVVIAGTLDPLVGGQRLAVNKVAVHPSYDFDAGHGHDIAVWTLAEPIALEAAGLTTVEMQG